MSRDNLNGPTWEQPPMFDPPESKPVNKRRERGPRSTLCVRCRKTHTNRRRDGSFASYCSVCDLRIASERLAEMPPVVH